MWAGSTHEWGARRRGELGSFSASELRAHGGRPPPPALSGVRGPRKESPLWALPVGEPSTLSRSTSGILVPVSSWKYLCRAALHLCQKGPWFSRSLGPPSVRHRSQCPIISFLFLVVQVCVQMQRCPGGETLASRLSPLRVCAMRFPLSPGGEVSPLLPVVCHGGLCFAQALRDTNGNNLDTYVFLWRKGISYLGHLSRLEK